jgi:hypothetical protein
MDKCPVLYSVNTKLAYYLAQTYYNSIHYVWCTRKYKYHGKQPASSDPSILCRRFLTDVVTSDFHSDVILKNKAGLLRGVEAKKAEGVIDETTSMKLRSLIENASIFYYSPLIYIIDFSKVYGICEKVPEHEKASTGSDECRISHLQRDYFEIIDIHEIVHDTGLFQNFVI